MKMGRVLPISALTLTLGGCWMGAGLYSASDARPAIPSGTYRGVEPGGVIKSYQVTALPNGLTQVDDGEDKIPYGFAPLGPDIFVAWLEMNDEPAASDKTVPNQFYGLLVRQSEGRFIAYIPVCKDEAAGIAKRNGAKLVAGPSPECRFSSRSSFEKALRLYPHSGPGLELTRISQ